MDLFIKVKAEKRVKILLLLFIVWLIYQHVPVERSRFKLDLKNTTNPTDFFTDWRKLTTHKGKISLTSLQPLLKNASISPTWKNATGRPVILIWTTYFGNDPLSITGGFNTSSCDYDCEYTKDRMVFRKSDAVIFHGQSTQSLDTPLFLNMSRPPGQIWIYINLESPIYVDRHGISPSFAASFNWTMTYRKDADIYVPYGHITETPPISGEHWEEIENKRKSTIMQKTKLVVWAVSNCITENKRQDLVKGLQRYITIDIVGGCGDRKYCPRAMSDDTCFAKFEADYKFYLSFENSFCHDYVTEKFFNPMKHDIVPIVYSGADLDGVGAPRGSYIDIRDFNGSHSLADYLIELDRDVEKYAKYFEYKRNYRVHMGSDVSWCKLCEKLYKQRDLTYSQWYPDILEWYENKYHDRTSTGLKMCVGRDEIRFNN